ncbi:bifunctional riboflavin kinase/FAD synthetase [Winogradskyella immobilis]|uniref:Riboflavin biosynthesis protein n=1 Tax=Winogradskyella immobilis TaxID=2816852 RepID=A0ABS8EMD9_9FLAO|nr:bifunctional riboflavin kinase/FAD synthetase [Winogradskyella immobilis]MCC1484388.1 bifunctional riboflavin kinase/FAD synthetase [Winogradskyella immobilis]MCG0016480.1 bifunctional riboflavin kinase/FAD synthetase [Winogradskyella immobilis]
MMSKENQNSQSSCQNSVVTIGTFDGLHIGHQKILNRVLDISRVKDLNATVLTLFPHPRMVLQKDSSIRLLNTIDERIALLKQFNIKCVVVKTFTKDFADLSARDYVKNILVDELNVKQIVIGYDHHFGKNRSANINDLKMFANEFHFGIEEITAQDIEDVTVSSTKIRKALDHGNVSLANSYLGYTYFLTGTVVKGKRIGRTIKFPTANIHIKEDYKLIPKDGVYVVSSIIDTITVYGMMNIGNNPTVDGKAKSIEVHFFNFNTDIYNKTLKIEMHTRLRDERKYDSVDLLRQQLQRDKEASLNYIETLK